MKGINGLFIFAGAYAVLFCEVYSYSVEKWLGAQVDLLPALMVCGGLNLGLWGVTGLAVGSGLAFDAMSANPLGTSVGPLFVVGYLIFTKRDFVLRDQAYAQWVLGVFASAVAPLMTLLILLSAGERPLLSWFSAWQWAVMTIVGASAAPLFCWALCRLQRSFGHPQLPEAPYRANREIKRGRL